jgi:DNA-binding NarL/FixJ family response regulator
VLVAEGLSNSEIGDRLYIGQATVKTHITRILAKTRVRDRAQAVLYAYETGLAKRVWPGRPNERAR